MNILGAGWCRLDAIVGLGPLERLRGLVEAFAREVAAHPDAARLVLVAPDVGSAALTHTARTRRLVERVICWSLRASTNTPPRSTLAVKAILSDGARLVRARLSDDRTSALKGELSDLCAAAVASEGTPRDRNRFLRSRESGASVPNDRTSMSYASRTATGTNPLSGPHQRSPVPVALTMSTLARHR